MRTRATLCCAAALAALSLAACQKKDEGGAAAAASAAAPAADAAAAPPADAASEPAARAARSPDAPPLIAQLAYRYVYDITAPRKAVRMLVDKHEQACVAAGPATCQVIGANVATERRDRMQAVLTLRGTPDWIARFRAALPSDLEAVDAKVRSSGIQTEDLSRALTDTAAEAKAQAVLRDRLERMVAERQGRLKDVLEVEQARAQAQAQVDAARSDLAGMRTRVAMSEVQLTYSARPGLAPDGALAPLGEAAGDVAGIAVAVLAFLLRSGAVLAPVGALAWIVWRIVRRRLRVPAA